MKKIALILSLFFVFNSADLFATTSQYSIIANRPAQNSDDVIVSKGTSTLQKGQFQTYSFFEYGYKPLELTLAGNIVRSVVDDLFVQHLGLGYGILDRFQVDLDLPVIWYNQFYNPTPAATTSDNKMGIGDLWVRFRYQILDRQESWLGLAFFTSVGLPTGNENHYVSDRNMTGSVGMAIDKSFFKNHLLLNLNVGAWVREDIRFTNLRSGSRLNSSVGAVVKVHKNVKLKTDLYVGSPFEELYKNEVSTPMEVMAAVQYDVPKSPVTLSVGGSKSLLRAAETPLYRINTGIIIRSKSKATTVRIVDTVDVEFKNRSIALRKSQIKKVDDYLRAHPYLESVVIAPAEFLADKSREMRFKSQSHKLFRYLKNSYTHLKVQKKQLIKIKRMLEK